MHSAATVHLQSGILGRCFWVCSNTILNVFVTCGIRLGLLCTGGHTLVHTSKLPLSLRDVGCSIERKVRSVGDSEAINFAQGTYTSPAVILQSTFSLSRCSTTFLAIFLLPADSSVSSVQ